MGYVILCLVCFFLGGGTVSGLVWLVAGWFLMSVVIRLFKPTA